MSASYDQAWNNGMAAGLSFGAILFWGAVLIILTQVPGCVRDNCQAEAVKAGKAEYYLDDNNVRKWRWKP